MNSQSSAESLTTLVTLREGLFVPRLTIHVQRVLDVGCGASRAFDYLANEGALVVGIDVDRRIRPRPGCPVVIADAHALPFPDGCFELVVSRVSVPYLDIPRFLREAHRVLQSPGVLWMTLHPFRMALMRILGDLRHGELQDAIFQMFVMLNGLLLHWGGRVARFPRTRRYESIQTVRGMRRALRDFHDVQTERPVRAERWRDRQYGRLFVVQAYR